MLTLNKIRAFLALSKTENLSEAARLLHLSKGAVSQNINELEAILGVKLFERANAKLRINNEGKALLPYVCDVLERIDEIESLFHRNAVDHVITIGASQTIGNYLLPKLMASLEMTCTPFIANTEDICQHILTYDIDVGLIEGALHHRELHSTPWMLDELIVITAGKVSSSNSYSQENWLVREPGSGSRKQTEAFLSQHKINVNTLVEMNATEAIIVAVSNGMGKALVSKHAAKDKLRLGDVMQDTSYPTETRTLSLVWHKKKYRSDKFLHFVEHCRAFADAFQHDKEM